jgi:hypothetical protein
MHASWHDRRAGAQTKPTMTCGVQLRKMAELFGDRAYVSLCLRRRPNDRMRLHRHR